MRACIQRVQMARVEVAGVTIGEIGRGLLVLLGVENGDTEKDLSYLTDKTCGLRIFEDDLGKMNLSVAEVGGELLVVSQFTLMGNCKKGKRPSFVDAAEPGMANRMYEAFVQEVKSRMIPVATGQFQADMQVTLCNDGPVTILLDSRKAF